MALLRTSPFVLAGFLALACLAPFTEAQDHLIPTKPDPATTSPASSPDARARVEDDPADEEFFDTYDPEDDSDRVLAGVEDANATSPQDEVVFFDTYDPDDPDDPENSPPLSISSKGLLGGVAVGKQAFSVFGRVGAHAAEVSGNTLSLEDLQLAAISGPSGLAYRFKPDSKEQHRRYYCISFPPRSDVDAASSPDPPGGGSGEDAAAAAHPSRPYFTTTQCHAQ